jgi:hypothetical protein
MFGYSMFKLTVYAWVGVYPPVAVVLGLTLFNQRKADNSATSMCRPEN